MRRRLSTAFDVAIEADWRPEETWRLKMATIGTFNKKDGKLNGKIRTLTLNIPVELVPTNASGENEPSHRVFSGQLDYA